MDSTTHAARTGLDRRDFLKLGAGAAGAVMLAGAGLGPLAGMAHAAMGADAFAVPPLPYAENALEPAISAMTVSYHYGKHTKGYYSKLNAAVAETAVLQDMPLDAIILYADETGNQGLFNNAAQSWNHTFYWNGLKAGGGGMPSGMVRDAIGASFGRFDAFREAFIKAGETQFASGWAWLAEKDGKLVVAKTPNAYNPMVKGFKPLMTLDVWEHAYYLDYQNRRGDHLAKVFDTLINWDEVARRMQSPQVSDLI